MRTAGTSAVRLAGRGQDGDLQLHRRLVQPCTPPLRHRLPVTHRLRRTYSRREDRVVPAARDARRYLVLVVSEHRKGDHDYFAAIWKQMNAGGYGAMLHDQMSLDNSGFNVRAVPVTDALQQQKKLSLPTVEAWW